jgi:hypothetical protein
VARTNGPAIISIVLKLARFIDNSGWYRLIKVEKTGTCIVVQPDNLPSEHGEYPL